VQLEQHKHIKMVRRIKQCITSANQCLATNNEDGHRHWNKKADMLKHDLGKSLGLESTAIIHLVDGSTDQITVEEVRE
jgi:hypothetical protein